MTVNVYFGTDLGVRFAAKDLPELLEGVGNAWAGI